MTVELADFVDGTELPACAGSGGAAVSHFAGQLYRMLVPAWSRFAIELDELFGNADASRSGGGTLELAQVLFASRAASGRTCLSTIGLRHSVERSRSGRYSSVLEQPEVRPLFDGVVSRPRLYVRGKRSCVRRLAQPLVIQGDRQAVELMEDIFRCARRESRCARIIGGPIDMGVIDASGRRWLRRKPDVATPAGHATTAKGA